MTSGSLRECRVREMRTAIDMIEGALMGWADFDFDRMVELFAAAPDHLVLQPKMTVGQLRRISKALAECTRIINSPEYELTDL